MMSGRRDWDRTWSYGGSFFNKSGRIIRSVKGTFWGIQLSAGRGRWEKTKYTSDMYLLSKEKEKKQIREGAPMASGVDPGAVVVGIDNRTGE